MSYYKLSVRALCTYVTLGERTVSLRDAQSFGGTNYIYEFHEVLSGTDIKWSRNRDGSHTGNHSNGEYHQRRKMIGCTLARLRFRYF